MADLPGKFGLTSLITLYGSADTPIILSKEQEKFSLAEAKSTSMGMKAARGHMTGQFK